jgi:hypothetical protein
MAMGDKRGGVAIGVFLALTLLAYALPWGTRVTGWYMPEGFVCEPSPVGWEHVSGARMGLDLGRVAVAQVLRSWTPSRPWWYACWNMALAVAHLTPLFVAAAMLGSILWRHPRRVPPRLRLTAMLFLVFVFLNGSLRIPGRAFVGAERAGYREYMAWHQTWLSGSLLAMICFATALVLIARRNKPTASQSAKSAT